MALLQGHPSQGPVMIPTGYGNGAMSVGSPNAPRTVQTRGTVVDGTPVRVVTYALAAAVGLVALRMAGFKFNVGVAV